MGIMTDFIALKIQFQKSENCIANKIMPNPKMMMAKYFMIRLNDSSEIRLFFTGSLP